MKSLRMDQAWSPWRTYPAHSDYRPEETSACGSAHNPVLLGGGRVGCASRLSSVVADEGNHEGDALKCPTSPLKDQTK